MKTPPQLQLARELFDSYDSYKATILSRRFTQVQLFGWLSSLNEKRTFNQAAVGTSSEGRTISLLTSGGGQTRVLLWSQMHGDEPTATMALVDLLSFFTRNPSHSVTKTIRDNLTLLIIPMLNPDGAERFQRRNAQAIDVNRDALTLETPEARILKEVRARYDPEYGFNLHDQEPRYTVGTTKNVTAIALLAPAADEVRSDTPARRKAKHVAAVFASVMSQFIAGHVAKYDDTFEPRAFGDNIQKWGTSTVLIESGGWQNDREKMFLRKLNCVGLLATLYSIATGSDGQQDVNVYEDLPFNTKYLYDLIVRNAQLQADKNVPALRVDVGINFNERLDGNSRVCLEGTVLDIGDLSVFTSFEEIDAKGAALDPSIIGLEKPISYEVAHALGRNR